MTRSNKIPVITVDGPGGSGKGTICALLAQELGWHLLDSGALYRLVALGAQQNGIDFSDHQTLAEYALKLPVLFEFSAGSLEVRTLLNGQDVGNAIRTEQAGNAASIVAAINEVREALLQRQRDFLQLPGLVADGRDMGTTVFPQARLKIFLTASAEERAQRRYKQLIEKGINVNLRDLLTEITERDERDTQRSASPLRPAEDAVTLDTSSMSIDEVFQHVMQLHHQRFLESTS